MYDINSVLPVTTLFIAILLRYEFGSRIDKYKQKETDKETNILHIIKKTSYNICKLWILIVMIGFVQSCSSNKRISHVTTDTDCPPVMDYITSDFVLLDSLLADAYLTSSYSTKSIIVANAYGLINDIIELKMLKNKEIKLKFTDSIRLLTIEKEHEIDKILNLAILEIHTLQTFLSCNNLKLIRAKTDLAAINNKSRSAYTNSAIIIGVASSVLVAGAVLSDGKLNSGDFKDWVGIAGGLVAAGLAIKSEKINKKINLSHENNAIAAIWNGTNDEGVFTDNTWYLLNQPSLVNTSELSLRELIIRNWETSKGILLEEDHLKYVQTIIGSGDEYTEEMIQLRIDMLEEVKQSIEEISRLLSLLIYEID